MKFPAPHAGLSALLTVAGMCGIANAQSVFTVHKTGSFHHILSTLPGSFDLLADTARATTDADSLKDFVDTDVGGEFEGKWKAGNATTFVNAPGYPTFNAQNGSADFTVAKIDSLFKAGTPVTLQNSPGTGSKHVYIAKIRGGSTYVIVKFLSRIGNNNDCACSNMGITTFEYWKMPSATSGIRSGILADQPKIRIKQASGNHRLLWTGGTAGGLNTVNALGRFVPGSMSQAIQKAGLTD